MMDVETPYQCRCCGSLALPERPFMTCPICGWDESALRRSRISFAEHGHAEKVDPLYLRAPYAHEQPPVEWTEARDELARRNEVRDAVESAIVEAFADVTGQGRIKLAEAWRDDMDDVPLPIEWDEGDVHWTDIPDDVLSKFDERGGQAFSFGNDESRRFYLPAYMRLGLRGDPDGALRALKLYRAELIGREPLLNASQREAALAFLRYLATHATYERDGAKAAQIERSWREAAETASPNDPNVAALQPARHPDADSSRHVVVRFGRGPLTDASTPYQCQCCGSLALPERPFMACPICGWDEIALRRSRISFAEHGHAEKVNPLYLRAPYAHEQPPVEWTEAKDELARRNEARDAVESAIEEAFADVTGEGRIKLAEAWREDMGDFPLPIEWDEGDVHWTDIPDDVLNEFAERGNVAFTFGNSESYRFYLPAYMRLGLRDWPCEVLLALARHRTKLIGREPLLNASQREAVLAFLRYLATYGPKEVNAAQDERIWREAAETPPDADNSVTSRVPLTDTATPYQCPCCGSLALRPFMACPICGWNEKTSDPEARENALRRSRVSFAQHGHAEGVYPPHLRAPYAHEQPPVEWTEARDELARRNEARAAVENAIKEAFADVTGEGRLKLAEAFRKSRDDAPLPIVWDEGDVHWTDIPDHVLSEFDRSGGSIFIFGNDESCRFYLPAYMRLGLRRNPGGALWALLDRPKLTALLNASQREAALAFLRYLATYGRDGAEAAQIERSWREAAESESPK